jgi:hypothetical protein
MNFNSDEMLHAAVLREMERGERRDGLWAQALSATQMDKKKATAKYIELRVQSMKDDMKTFIKGNIKI